MKNNLLESDENNFEIKKYKFNPVFKDKLNEQKKMCLDYINDIQLTTNNNNSTKLTRFSQTSILEYK